jgi:hypothetical protein
MSGIVAQLLFNSSQFKNRHISREQSEAIKKLAMEIVSNSPTYTTEVGSAAAQYLGETSPQKIQPLMLEESRLQINVSGCMRRV